MNAENTMQQMMDFYGEIFPTRKHCLDHLFCVIGNGYEWVNGELVEKYNEVTSRYKMVKDIKRAEGRREYSWWEEYKREEELERKLAAIGETHPFRRLRVFEWYPIYSSSYILNYPEDITDSWREALEECKNLLIEDGIMDSEGNVVRR